MSLEEKESVVSLYLKGCSPIFWVSFWLVLNIALTLVNKGVFYYGHFNYPVTLSAIHMLTSSIFTLVCVRILKWFPSKQLNSSGNITMMLFSTLFSSNIVFGNFSLQTGSLSLVQVIRAIIPGITMLLSIVILGKRYTAPVVLSMIPICAGMMMTVKGDLQITTVGLTYSFIGSFLSALKVVFCNKFLVGAWSMHPIDLLDKTTFWAFLQVLFFVYYLEWDSIRENWAKIALDGPTLFFVFGSAITAFLLNVANFYTNLTSSPLVLSVSGNIKQCVSIISGIILFHEVIGTLNALGISITIFGTILFNVASHKAKAASAPNEPKVEEKPKEEKQTV